jgi:hypothetical protein
MLIKNNYLHQRFGRIKTKINQKYFRQFFSVAIRLGRSDIVDLLVKENKEKNIQLDIRVKKYVKTQQV